jgi:hypothetical protein
MRFGFVGRRQQGIVDSNCLITHQHAPCAPHRPRAGSHRCAHAFDLRLGGPADDVHAALQQGLQLLIARYTRQLCRYATSPAQKQRNSHTQYAFIRLPHFRTNHACPYAQHNRVLQHETEWSTRVDTSTVISREHLMPSGQVCVPQRKQWRCQHCVSP